MPKKLPINSIYQRIPISFTGELVLAYYQLDDENVIAEMVWDGKERSLYVYNRIPIKQLTVVMDSKTLGDQELNIYAIDTLKKTYITPKQSDTVNAHLWINNASITLDSEDVLSFDGNITTINDDYFQILSTALVVPD